MKSSDFADYINGIALDRYEPLPEIDWRPSIDLVEGALWKDGQMLDLYFAPSDENYDYVTPMASLATNLLEYFIEDIREFQDIGIHKQEVEKLFSAVETIKKMNVNDLKNGISIPLSDGITWVGKLVNCEEAIADVTIYRPLEGAELPPPRYAF